MDKYEIVLTLEVRANSPTQAAIIARDAILNPDNHLPFDVHDMRWHEEAWAWVPQYDHGWQARFDGGKVRPSHMIAWERMN